TVPIGAPLSNTTAYVLDASFEPAGVGIPGEICIGGSGNAMGYLRRSELTAERFVPDPFGPPGTTLYRTRDAGRRGRDGTIEFIGRADHQVKVRGFRIELGEIESALGRLSGVRQAVVTAREDVGGEKRIVAYVVGDPGSAFNRSLAKTELAKTLPDFMLPSAFVELNALPLTTNGKVNRSALPAPDWREA